MNSRHPRDTSEPQVPGAKRLGRRPNVIVPLTDDELDGAARVARRLHAELRNVHALLPDGERGASAISRALELDRATCQRIVSTLAEPAITPETLAQFPGVIGMRQFLAALGERHLGRAANERLAAAAAAIDQLDAFLRESGGSQRLFRQRLEASRTPVAEAPGPPTDRTIDDLAAREALYRAAVQATGRWSETTIHTSIIRPSPNAPTQTESVRLRALIGHAWGPVSVPLEIGETAALQTVDGEAAFATLDSIPASGRTQSSLMARFCSEPLPRVISRASGARVVHVIEPPETHIGAEAGPLDIVTAHRSANPDHHPATLRPAIGELWALQNFPARRLVFDTFLHREIARRCIPAVELHLWTPGVSQQGACRWSTRFPLGPRLEVMGIGIERAHTDGYARYTELLADVYAQLGWPANEFVGYRCEVAFPMWRAGYCMIFDFTGNEMDTTQ